MIPGLDILNCADGHTEISFEGDALEMARADRIIQDMLRRGYVLFIHGEDNALIRVQKFDAAKKCYVIADGPLYAGETPAPKWEKDRFPAEPEIKAPRGRTKKTREVPMAEVKATAIPRSAGG